MASRTGREHPVVPLAHVTRCLASGRDSIERGAALWGAASHVTTAHNGSKGSTSPCHVHEVEWVGWLMAMADKSAEGTLIDSRVAQVFALVSEALAGATHALLSGDTATGQAIIDSDKTIDQMTQELTGLIWQRVESGAAESAELRRLVGVLLILPELERSADLGEHIAQRAVAHLGRDMSPLSRGLVQRMSEVALEMWRAVADAYARSAQQGIALNEADEELDELHERLTLEVANGTMTASVASQVTLVARFYERLGDHAVNLARRIDALHRRGDGTSISLA